MIIDYDRNPQLNTDRKLDSLKESVQMALNEVQTSLINLKAKPKAKEIIGLMDFFYPVGSYYETSDTSFDPNNAWGGAWVLEAAGNFHVSAGTGYSTGSTGGSPYIQAHTHGFTNPTISEKAADTSGTPSNDTSGTPSNNTSGTPSTANTGAMSANASHSHGADGASYHLATNATAVGRRTIKNGTGTSYSDNIYTEGGAIVRKSSTDSASVAHTHSLNSHTHSLNSHTHSLSSHTHSIPKHSHTASGGSVNAINTAGLSTGNAGNMPPYIAVNRWHRTA